MRPLWQCEVCERTYPDPGAATACEAEGRPEPPRYLYVYVGQEVPAFGEAGVELAVNDGFEVRHEGGHHALYVRGAWPGADHSRGVDWSNPALPVRYLDPMVGGAFLRHVTAAEIEAPQGAMRSARGWLVWCRRYGYGNVVPPDPTRAAWWAPLPDDKRAAFLRALLVAMEAERMRDAIVAGTCPRCGVSNVTAASCAACGATWAPVGGAAPPVPAGQPRHADEVITAVCRHFRVSTAELVGPDRHKTIAFARHVSMYVCKTRLRGMSFPDVGRAFGDREHSTVMAAVSKIEAAYEADADVRRHVDTIVATLGTHAPGKDPRAP